MKAVVVGKLVGETEGAGADLRLDSRQVGTGTPEVRLVRDPRHRGTETLAIDRKIKLDSMGTCRYDSARDRFATHLEPPNLVEFNVCTGYISASPAGPAHRHQTRRR
jgi:hypothetical protein